MPKALKPVDIERASFLALLDGIGAALWLDRDEVIARIRHICDRRRSIYQEETKHGR